MSMFTQPASKIATCSRNCTWIAAFAATLVTFASNPSNATLSAISTGLYGDLLIGYDPATHVVTGFRSADSTTPVGKHACTFYFSGVLEHGKAHVRLASADSTVPDIQGIVTTSFPGNITVRLDAAPRGCAPEEAYAVSEATALHLSHYFRWKAIRTVKRPATALHSKSEQYTLSSGEPVGVVEASKESVTVDHLVGKTVQSGWVREQDLAPVAPSSSRSAL